MALKVADYGYVMETGIHADFALLGAYKCDEYGNCTVHREIGPLDVTAMAQACKNSGGKVIVQVEKIVQGGSLDPKLVAIPGIYVDSVVVGTEEENMQCLGMPYDGALTGEFRSFPEDHYVFMSTRLGTVKKTPLSDFSNPRKAGIIAVALDEGDYLIGAEITSGTQDIVLVSDAGKAVWFDEEDVRPMGRTARGVRGMKLGEGQQVLSLLVAANHQETVLIATENGFGKRTVLADFRHSGRGTQGVIAIAASERNGKVVAARLVQDQDEIMLITTGGVLIRTRVSEIRELGRATQGVTLIALDEGEKLAGLEKVVETEDEQDVNGDVPPESSAEGTDQE